MKSINLSGNKGAGMTALVDDEDYDRLSKQRWYLSKQGYAERPNRPGKGRIPMQYEIVQAPKGMVRDHINGNKLDNRRCNLRVCTQSQNKQNARVRRDSSTGYKGVVGRENVWTVLIKIGDRRVNGGRYPAPEIAAAQYNRMALEHFGEYALLNELPRVVTDEEIETARLRHGRGKLSQMGRMTQISKRAVGRAGYRGVLWIENKKRFVVQFEYGGKRHSAGHFYTVLAAAYAYNLLATDVCGEYAVLNTLPPEAATAYAEDRERRELIDLIAALDVPSLDIESIRRIRSAIKP